MLLKLKIILLQYALFLIAGLSKAPPLYYLQCHNVIFSQCGCSGTVPAESLKLLPPRERFTIALLGARLGCHLQSFLRNWLMNVTSGIACAGEATFLEKDEKFGGAKCLVRGKELRSRTHAQYLEWDKNILRLNIPQGIRLFGRFGLEETHRCSNLESFGNNR